MKQAIVGYVTALINTHKGNIREYRNPLVRECKLNFLRELNSLLEFINNAPKETKDHITVVFDEENYKNQIYKQSLEEVLTNLRSIELPNQGDSYINNSIEIITKLLTEEE